MSVSFNEDTLFITIPERVAPSITIQSNPATITIAAVGKQGGTGLRGPTGPSLPIVFARRGTCEVAQGRLKYRMPWDATLTYYSAAMGEGTPPMGRDLLADLQVNGITVATITVPDGEVDVPRVVLDLSVEMGDYLTVDQTQVGSSDPGEDLSIFIEFEV